MTGLLASGRAGLFSKREDAKVRAAYNQIELLIQQVIAVPGDFAEFGVWKGDIFIPLAKAAASAGKTAHAIDTFTGMAEPTAKDYEPNGQCNYPVGCLNPGPDAVNKILSRLSDVSQYIKIWQGCIPEILSKIPNELLFAFAHIDLDHYMPTLDTLRWIWPRVISGGIVCCHDYFEGLHRLASMAISDWMDEMKIKEQGRLESNHIWFMKE